LAAKKVAFVLGGAHRPSAVLPAQIDQQPRAAVASRQELAQQTWLWAQRLESTVAMPPRAADPAGDDAARNAEPIADLAQGQIRRPELRQACSCLERPRSGSRGSGWRRSPRAPPTSSDIEDDLRDLLGVDLDHGQSRGDDVRVFVGHLRSPAVAVATLLVEVRQRVRGTRRARSSFPSARQFYSRAGSSTSLPHASQLGRGGPRRLISIFGNVG
jgi:hypothetical protein